MCGEMSRQLDGRGCVVTGASGIAAAAVRRFRAEGAAVVVIGKVADECAALGEPYAVADLSDEHQAVAAFATARDELGRLDALFAVAGGSGRRIGDGPLHDVSAAAWDGTLAMNATPAFLAAREALRWMLDQPADDDGERGSIVLTASVLAFDPAPTHFATHAYAAAKAAIIGLARATAATYVADGIRVNVIAPGLVATPMAARAAADPAVMAFAAGKQPLAGGMLAADDVVDAAVYLCGRASRRVTGQTLAVDGGWTVRGEAR